MNEESSRGSDLGGQTPAADHDTSPAPEVDSPGGVADGPCLCLRLVDAALRPLPQVAFELRGPSVAVKGLSDAEGLIEVDGCAPGAYDLVIGDRTIPVHTIYLSDLESDPEPYRVLAAEA